MYLVLIPLFGTPSVFGYETVKSFAKALTKWLERKRKNIFEGDILLFRGQKLEYSDHILSYRLNVPEVGEFAVSDTAKGKYVEKQPKISK